jgi:predicted GIY-YIG superfamily endonuclease
MPYYTYILYSKSMDSYYVGQTQDLVERLHHYHNAGKCNYTKRGEQSESTKSCLISIST